MIPCHASANEKIDEIVYGLYEVTEMKGRSLRRDEDRV